MRVLDPTESQRPLKVEMSVSPAYELLMSLCVFDSAHDQREIYEVGAAWFESVSSRASPALLAKLDQSVTPHITVWPHLLGLVYASPAPHDIPTFLAYLQEIPAMELRLNLMGFHYGDAFRHGVSRDTLLAAVHGDQKAQEHIISSWYADEPHYQDALRALLSEDPAVAKSRTLQILSDWYEQVFRTEEERIMPIIQRDADAKRVLAKSMTAERLVETATNGIQYRAEPGIEVVVLAPSVFSRPWVSHSQHGTVRIFCYPVADESMTSDVHAPPAHLVRLYEALADERRLRVLRKLAAQPSSLQELADFLGIAKSTMHHHLAILRGAGLLRLELHGKRYTLRREALAEIPALLDVYVDGR